MEVVIKCRRFGKEWLLKDQREDSMFTLPLHIGIKNCSDNPRKFHGYQTIIESQKDEDTEDKAHQI